MATVVGSDLPPLLMARLGPGSARATAGTPALHECTAIPICTVDPDGLPHPAMLSYAELAADDARSIRAAVYGGSSTARHLRQHGKITLLFVDEEGTYYVKAAVSGPETPHPATAGVTVFALSVVAVLADAVDTCREPDAIVTSGVRFRRTAASGLAAGTGL
jgi:hypothetical protein